MLSLELRPIGKIKRLSDTQCDLLIRETYIDGLVGLRPGDTIQVLYWMHELSFRDRRRLQTHPGGDPTYPERGVFSLRSCMRPNPIGVTIVEITHLEGNRLGVLGMDANDGAPIIDIKACVA